MNVRSKIKYMPSGYRPVGLGLMLRGPSVPFDGAEPAAAAPEPAAPTPEPAAEPSAHLASSPTEGNDWGDLFAFDPFAEPKTPEPAAPAAGSVPAPEPAPTPTPPATPPAGSDALVADLMRQQNEILARLAPQAPQGEPQAPTNPFANVSVPENLMNGIGSEDPVERATSLNLIVQGVANLAFQRSMQEFGHFIQNGLPRLLSQHHESTTTQQTVEQDFYGKYPELNVPALRPMVQSIGAQVLQELKATGWSAQVRDAIAERVVATLSGVVKPRAPTPPAPTPFTPGGGPRPAPAAPNDILDTLFG